MIARLTVIALCGSALAVPSSAQCEVAKLLGSQSTGGDRAGRAVANTGSTAFVGAPYDDVQGTDAGSVNVYRRSGLNWPETQVLIGSQSSVGDLFGSSLAVFETSLAVGSPYEDGSIGDMGGVYLFQFNGTTWLETQLFTAPDGALGDLFGTAIDLNATTLVVGAPQDDDNGSNSGSVYVYTLDSSFGWILQDKLVHSLGSAGDRFGTSVALDPTGDYLVVGSPSDDVLGNGSGSTVVFGRTSSGWIELSTQQPTGGAAGDAFGTSVAFGSGFFVAGAPGHDASGSDSGAGFVFHQVLGAWVQEAALTARDATGGENLGFSVAASGGSCVLGAYADGHYGVTHGATYEYQELGGAWTFMAKLVPADGQAGDSFGYAVSMADENVLVGAEQDDDSGVNAGSAFIFRAPDFPVPYCFCDPVVAPCSNPDQLAGCRTFTGRGGLLTACGLPSIAADQMTLTLSQVPSNQFGIMFMGRTQANVPFGNGRLCVGQSASSPVYRYPPQSTGSAGTFTYGPGLTAYGLGHFSVTGQFAPGDVWHFQTWFRDPLGPCGSSFNLSNGLAVTMQP
jgi:hypothetical protein